MQEVRGQNTVNDFLAKGGTVRYSFLELHSEAFRKLSRRHRLFQGLVWCIYEHETVEKLFLDKFPREGNSLGVVL